MTRRGHGDVAGAGDDSGTSAHHPTHSVRRSTRIIQPTTVESRAASIFSSAASAHHCSTTCRHAPSTPPRKRLHRSPLRSPRSDFHAITAILEHKISKGSKRSKRSKSTGLVTYRYRVAWAGLDEHGSPWPHSWCAEHDVTAVARSEYWRVLRETGAKEEEHEQEEEEEVARGVGDADAMIIDDVVDEENVDDTAVTIDHVQDEENVEDTTAAAATAMVDLIDLVSPKYAIHCHVCNQAVTDAAFYCKFTGMVLCPLCPDKHTCYKYPIATTTTEGTSNHLRRLYATSCVVCAIASDHNGKYIDEDVKDQIHVATVCGHVLDLGCLQALRGIPPWKCPVCRAALTPSTQIVLYADVKAVSERVRLVLPAH